MTAQDRIDRPESIEVRLVAYERSTAPLIDFCRRLDLLLSIPATGSPDQICSRTQGALNLQNEFPRCP
jgi:adenylate kinase family enzyme